MEKLKMFFALAVLMIASGFEASTALPLYHDQGSNGSTVLRADSKVGEYTKTNFIIRYKDSLLYDTEVLSDVMEEQPAQFISFIVCGKSALSYVEKNSEVNETRNFDVKTTLGDFNSVSVSFSIEDGGEKWSLLLQFEDGKRFTLTLTKLKETRSYPKWKSTISATWFTNSFSASESDGHINFDHLRQNLFKFSFYALKKHPMAFNASLTIPLKTSIDRMWKIFTNWEDKSWVKDSKHFKVVDEGSGQIARTVTLKHMEDKVIWERVIHWNKNDMEFAYEYGQNEIRPKILNYMGFITLKELGPKLCQLSYENIALTSMTKEETEKLVRYIYHNNIEWFQQNFNETEEKEQSSASSSLARLMNPFDPTEQLRKASSVSGENTKTNFIIQFNDSLLYDTEVLSDVIEENPAEFISFIISGKSVLSYEMKNSGGDKTRTLNVMTTFGDFDSVDVTFSVDDDEDGEWSVLLRFEDGKKFSLTLTKLKETELYPKWKSMISATWSTNGFMASNLDGQIHFDNLRQNFFKFSHFALKKHPEASNATSELLDNIRPFRVKLGTDVPNIPSFKNY